MLSGPLVPAYSLLSEVEKWVGDLGVIWDKVAIVACEAKELMDFGWVSWGFPLSYAVKFAWVHAHLVFPNNYP
jgi:hypothetical protein